MCPWGRATARPAILDPVRNVPKAALSVAAATTLVGVVLPWRAGTGWAAILGALSGVSVLAMLGLGVVWFAGVLAHTLVLTAGLPGLSIRQALLVNFTGSSVSNVLPLGGAAGTALNYSMCRRWGHPPAAIVLFTVVTHIWGLIAKLALPVLALAALLACGGSSAQLLIPALISLTALTAVLAGLAAVLAHEGAAVALGRGCERAVARAGRLVGRPWQAHLAESMLALRSRTITMTRDDWRRPLVGMLGYLSLQALLLWLCLQAVGSTVGPIQVFAAFAVERLLSVIALTPGGLGVVELAMAALLGAFGETSVTAAAGVLLYRAFTYALSIPVGGLLLAGWVAQCRRTDRPAAR